MRVNVRQYTMIIALLLVWSIFISTRNLSTLFLQSATVAIIARTMVLAMIAGNIDLSVGSAIGFTGAVVATFITKAGRPTLLAVLAMLFLGLVIGLLQGYWSSQVAIGKENGLRIRVYGTDGAIEWEQENPNVLRFQKKGGPLQPLTRGSGYLSAAAGHFTHLPAGHPEEYFEAFANLYRNFCNVLMARKQDRTPDPLDVFPTVVDGARGTKFVLDCVKSSKEGAAWVDASLDTLCSKMSSWRYDGLEIACWGEHLNVDNAVESDAYVRSLKDAKEKYDLQCHAIGNHLVG